MRIVVGGDERKSGKTALVCRIIALTKERNWTAVKISHHAPESGAAYTLQEESAGAEQGDSRRFLAAGAQRAYWLRGDCEAALADLLALLAGAANWIVESNRALRLLDYDLALTAGAPDVEDDDALLTLLGADRESK